MKDHVVESFESLLKITQYYRNGHWVFRGVSRESWALHPKVGRLDFDLRTETRVFDHFRREAVSYVENFPTSEWEILALAQHHGLPTRLMDWTENPLVAT
jgi:hypothetical protein